MQEETDICVHCGKKYTIKYKICGECGALYGQRQDFSAQANSAAILIEETSDLLAKESKLRLKIAQSKVKLKKLFDITPNNSGCVNIKVQNINISISSESFERIIHEEIKDLTVCLINANNSLRNFNDNLKI